MCDKIWKFEGQIDPEVQGHQFMNSKHSSILQVKFKIVFKKFKRYHFHKKSNKHLNLYDKIHLGSQGQITSFKRVQNLQLNNN